MRILTEDATLICRHDGRVQVAARAQDFVTVEGRLVLAATDPEGRGIVGCPMSGPGIKRCTNTLRVQTGYSTLMRIADRPVCLETVTGLTDGTPPGTVDYRVRNPGQALVDVTI
jgi:hypothetical protein